MSPEDYDSPATHFGLMITSGNASSGHSDIVFASSEEAGKGPRLVFSVPTPASGLLMLFGIISIVAAKTRHS